MGLIHKIIIFSANFLQITPYQYGIDTLLCVEKHFRKNLGITPYQYGIDTGSLTIAALSNKITPYQYGIDTLLRLIKPNHKSIRLHLTNMGLILFSCLKVNYLISFPLHLTNMGLIHNLDSKNFSLSLPIELHLTNMGLIHVDKFSILTKVCHDFITPYQYGIDT